VSRDVELLPIEIPVEKSHEITVAGLTLAGTSKQIDDWDDEWTPEDALQPPLDLDQLARLSQASGTRSSIIDAIARNTVGLGYTLEPAEGHEEEFTDPRATVRDAKVALEGAASRDLRMDRPSLTDLLYAVKTDEEEVGQGFIEVARDARTGMISGVFHCPGKRVRRLKDRSGYVMLQKGGVEADRVEFYNFGDKAEYNDDGQPIGIVSGRASKNELLSFKLYTSESRDYGLPRDVGLALEYLGDKLAAEYNVSFFNSGGTPPTVIFVTGEETEQGSRVVLRVPQSTVQQIGDTLKSDANHQKRVAIIPLPPGARAQAEKLGEVSDRDMGFVVFRKDNIRRFLSAFRLSPIFLASTEEAGRYTAEVERAITLEQVFDPEQSRYEERLSASVVKDLGFPGLRLKLDRLAVENDSAKRDSADKMAEAAVITVREFRDAHGKAPLPEAAEGATPDKGQYPFGINDRLVNTGTPRGAENRRVDGDDNRGLRDGIGAREQRSTDKEQAAQRVSANGR